MPLGGLVTSRQARVRDGLLVFLGPDVDAIRLLVEIAEKSPSLLVGLRSDAQFGEDYRVDRERRFADRFIGVWIDPTVCPFFEELAVGFWKGANTCSPYKSSARSPSA